ncbi:SDR family NAD(P)-dependent oxidoreductase [Streptomyces millisiae]|uniref:SDR family NAD(P)-dependent oxidoreductase n=1 Tax=Streptomyces millisiae TaxID=3075542 RepID=A0ABU2LZN7_9ACTN|nr:SDR family NAD(P)-dependent oxidoreductase [Streptomyces sp. DSM 44918]MDT0323057.1 SDR family NAD(P)-dependent oxidoreductase [Streptomyces sp. DSM 44918]
MSTRPDPAAPGERRTIVLVGATSGIGWHAALRLGALGHRLILVGRDGRRGERIISEVLGTRGADPGSVFLRGDVATRAGIEAVVRGIRARTDAVDTLINNAGVMVPRRQVTSEGHELNLAVHHLAPYTMTGLLLPLLERGDGRIVNTNSEGHRTTMTGGGVDLDFDDLQSERHYGLFLTYSRTKLANLLFTYEFHRRYPHLTIVAVHPGMVRTRLLRGVRNPALWLLNRVGRLTLTRPAEGARPLVHLATADRVANGRYHDRFTPTASSAQSMSRAGAERLWQITEGLRGPLTQSPAGGD